MNGRSHDRQAFGLDREAGSLSDGRRAEAAPDPISRSIRETGVNLIGFFRAEFGQGEVARRLAAALEGAGVPHSTTLITEIPHRYIPHRQDHTFKERLASGDHGTNIVCLNAEHLPVYAETTGRDVLADRYNVGVWFWETSQFPEELHGALDYVDEVWAASTFVADAIAAETWKPVLTFPLPVLKPPLSALPRAELRLPPDDFVFVFVFDFFSTAERKNPIGLIEAFKRAFEPDSGALLVIKSINGEKQPAELARLTKHAAGRPDIVIDDGYVDSDRVSSLIAAADCYVSLHRSEGFGLTIAEAMAYGKPAIATGYSGNLAFMNEDNSYLVPFALTTVPEDCGPYPAGAAWADPNLDAAAALMRRVFEHPDEARERAERGREAVLERHSVERTGSFLAERLTQIDRLRAERERVTTPARRVEEYVAAGPTTSWDAPSRFGFFGRLYRRLLRRALQPYLVRQREFELAVAAGLEQAEAMAQRQRDQLKRLEETVRRLDAQTEQLAALAAALERRLADREPKTAYENLSRSRRGDA